MREKSVIITICSISLLVVVLSLPGLVSLPPSSVRTADAAAPPIITAISPTGGTASPASLGTIITSGTSIVPTDLCAASCVITGGTRAGNNLFHSFGDFNIGTLDSARFQTGLVNPLPDASVSNILARVTGGPSNLFGNLNSATYYPSANLFLINPAGFLFGPNATVNVGGMMTVTTADYLKLVDNVRFNAIPNPAADTLLSTAPLAAFGFLGSNPAAITVQGSQLSVADGTGISLVGGGITIQSGTPDGGTAQPARLSAPNGKIQMASAASPGEFDAATLQPLPNVDGASFTSFGSVMLTTESSVAVNGTNTVSIRSGQFILSVNDAVLTTSQNAVSPETIVLSPNSSIVSSNVGADPGGDVQIRTGNFRMDGASILSTTTGGGQGGAVSVTATESASFTNSTIDSSTQFASGDSGPVTLTATNGPLSLINSTINTSSLFAGAGGAVIITANDNLTGLTVTNSTIDSSTQFASGGSGPVTLTATNGPLSMTNSIIHTASFLSGNAGAVTATGTTVTLDGTQVLTDATGDDTVGLPMIRSGAVTLTATDAIGGTVTVTNNSSISTQGIVTVLDSSPVTITGRTINILNRSTIDASTHNGGTLNSPANGGTIELRGSIVTVAGGSQLTSFADGNAQSTGTGGNIRFVGTDGIQSANNIQLTAAQLNTSATTLGGAGTIEFVTKRLTLGNTDVGAVTFGPGPGGSISVRGAVNVTLDSGSAMDTSAVNSGPEGPYGPAGTILLETQQLTMQRGSVLRAADLPLSHGDAGSITVQGTIGPGQSILIDGAGTGIFTDAKGTGAGGDITLNANSVTLQNGGTLSAVTSGTASSATGGSIQVDANHVQLNSGATITANSTGAADAGNINLTASNSFTMQNSSITTQANAAGGGTIKITTDPGGTVQLTNSTISASVLDGTGGGGSVNIDPQSVILLNSQILAQAVQGPGGNISITTNLLLPDANSVISASSQFGVNGTVTIQSPNAPTSGQIQPLGKSPLLATSLLNQHCASLAGGAFSSFTVAGRDSLPTEPGGWLSSPLYAAGVWLGIKAEGVKAEGERLEGMSASAGQVASGQWRVGDTPILSLRQIAPPGFLTQAFATDRSAGCQS